MSDRPRLLDLFCGAGGAAMGYHRAGFEVVGVDLKPQPHYPFEFHQADALEFPVEGFDAIHASPPCQAYVCHNKNKATKWPRLIEPVRERLSASGALYVIENVAGAPLDFPVTLCGTMFNLLVIRHRQFESNAHLWGVPMCDHWGTVSDGDYAAVYAFGSQGRYTGEVIDGTRQRAPKDNPGPDWGDAMGIDWMTQKELSQAIPPAYTEWIGKRLIEEIDTKRPNVSYTQVVGNATDHKRDRRARP